MTDFFVNLGKHPGSRKLIKLLKLPIVFPQELSRSTTAWEVRPLENMNIIVGNVRKTQLTSIIAKTLASAGADVHVQGDTSTLMVYNEEGTGYGRIPKQLQSNTLLDEFKPHAFVFDASGMQTASELQVVYDFFQKKIKYLGTCGRMIIIAQHPSTIKDIEAASAARALEGFVRSAGKEIGRNGSTSLIIYVDPEAHDRLEPVLRFFLSYRSAYVSGQPVHLSANVKIHELPYFTRPLDQKIALVTGAARGIGACIARTLAREGAHVICMDRPSENEPCARLADEIHGTLLLCDITSPDAFNSILDFIQKKWNGKLDIVIHNAGITRDKMLVNMTSEIWSQVLEVNLISIIRVNQALIPHIQKDGRIVCLSSIAGIAGNTGQTNYSASKAGIMGYVQALAPTLYDNGITINAVAPGFIETQMTSTIPLATREVARRLSSLAQGGLPEDVAEVVTFLSSPGASGITGEVLRICGGNFIGA
ncbi:MAG: 3-oxoacyl-ACP reductase [Desulfobacterales bacterium]|nr:3-oxoacyl-ACP reductase [Desulfobacterales bacterium]